MDERNNKPRQSFSDHGSNFNFSALLLHRQNPKAHPLVSAGLNCKVSSGSSAGGQFSVPGLWQEDANIVRLAPALEVCLANSRLGEQRRTKKERERDYTRRLGNRERIGVSSSPFTGCLHLAAIGNGGR